MTITNRNLYYVVETIAEKEIEKNPVDFIRRESFTVGEEFYPYENQGMSAQAGGGEDFDDDDEDENEYHQEEKPVGNRMRPYKDVKKDEESI